MLESPSNRLLCRKLNAKAGAALGTGLVAEMSMVDIA
jgi:hypothetical protein